MKLEVTDTGLRSAISDSLKDSGIDFTGEQLQSICRDVLGRLSPDSERFRPNDKVIWTHSYASEEHPPCHAVVCYWNQKKTRVMIRYENSLFDAPKGAEREAWVYPAELTLKKDWKGDLPPRPWHIERAPEDGK